MTEEERQTLEGRLSAQETILTQLMLEWLSDHPEPTVRATQFFQRLRSYAQMQRIPGTGDGSDDRERASFAETVEDLANQVERSLPKEIERRRTPIRRA